MPQDNFYYVFEPDQVLTETHLNQLFAYLDQQEHLTRNKLIGIGIVCGLNTSTSNNQITITKGVGITSLGYLLQFNGGTYTHYRSYTLPDFPETIEPSVHAAYSSWPMKLLVESEAPKQPGDTALNAEGDILKTHAVVLFLEPQLSKLKNCTTEDCNDKGMRVDVTVRPMLVAKTVLQQYKHFNLQQQKFNFPQVHLKRWNAPMMNMQHPVNIIQSYDNILSSALLREVAAACKFMYDVFHHVLNVDDDDTLNNVFNRLITLANTVRKNHTVHYQYVYDYVDDLIKAYYDFQEVIFDVLSECCPDENLFPLHLMLGDAYGNSTDSNIAYRNYFVYSPLFNQQQGRLEQAKMYYKRMLIMLEDFQIPVTNLQLAATALRTANNAILDIKITPSILGDYPLGKRCIPFYYKPDPLYKVWDYEKSRRGKAAFNNSYNAEVYSKDLSIVKPLLYDTERSDFYRIEGHTGKQVNVALRNIAQQKIQHNLPFDVVALNMYKGRTLQETDKLKCYFSDLESQYNVLLSEMLCKLHGLYCAAGKWTFNSAIFNTVFGRTSANAFNTSAATFTKEESKEKMAAAADEAGSDDESININEGTLYKTYERSYEESITALTIAATSFVDRARKINPYRKGTYMQYFCQPDMKNQTVSSYYLNWLKANEGKRWPKPQALVAGDNNVTKWMVTAYMHLFYLIDTIEEMLAKILPFDLNELNYKKFSLLYNEVMEEVEAYADYFDNLYHGLDILNDQKDIDAQKPFNLIQEELEDWVIDKAITKLTADSRGLIMMCADERLQQLQYEYRKRLAYVLEQQIFSNYAKLKTGLEHKAGVPKGGTFILLYFDKPDVIRSTNLSSFTNVSNVADKEDAAAAKEADIEKETTTATRVKLSDTEKLERNIAGINQIIESNKEAFAEGELSFATQLLSKLSTLPASAETINIPEGVVFADLYIPYICCSECAPIAFIFQTVKEEEPQPDIDIKRTFFCNNEDVKEPLTIQPEGGTVTGQGIIQEGNNYFFNPKGLAEGEYVIQYKLGSKSDNLTITVKAVFDPEFSFAEKGPDPASGAIVVAFNATSQQGQHLWNFGDNTQSSTEINPQHAFFFEGNNATFKVTHTVTNGNCTLPPLTKEITLKRENPVKLSIKKNPLCTNDNPEPLSYSPNGGTMNCKENQQAIQNINGAFVFAPQISGAGTFNVSYNANGFAQNITVEVQPAPAADFDFKIIERTQASIVVQFTSATKDVDHKWEFSDGQSIYRS